MASRASWAGPVDFVFGESDWLSRNISYALRKRLPIHVATRYWHFSDSTRHTTHDVWEAQEDDGKDSKELSAAKKYLQDKIGLDIEKIHGDEAEEAEEDLLTGELGFFGAYVPASATTVESKKGRMAEIKIGGHKGEFRFDGEARGIDAFVHVVSAETIRKPADTQSTILGLATEEGVSRRVGVGFIYHSKEPSSKHPPWEYKRFRLQ